MYDIQDIPKYIKNKQSCKSKAKKKSNHKHEYRDCLLIERKNDYPHKASCCKICGKIGRLSFHETEEKDGFFVVMDKEEVFEKYKNLEQIYIDDIWQKYVPIKDGDELVEQETKEETDKNEE